MRPALSTWVNVGILVLAGASFAAVVATRSAPTTAEGIASGPSLLPAFRVEDSTRLELESAGQKIAIERKGSAGGSAEFQLVAPVREPADPTAVDKLLTALANARALRPVDPGLKSSIFGLENPHLSVTLRTLQTSYELLVGNAAPAPTGARYVSIKLGSEPAKIVVIDKSVAEDLSVELDAFRQRSIVPLSEHDTIRITISSPTLAVTLRRASGIAFLIDGDPKLFADRETVASLFFQLGRLSATRFLTPSEAEAALGPKRAQFELEIKHGLFRFEVGGNCPADPAQLVVVRRAPSAQSACAPRDLEATLRLAASDLVDRHAFSLHADEVEELDMVGGAHKFALLRKGNGFVLHAGSEAAVDLEAGNQRIAGLLEAVGERVANKRLSDLGLDPAFASITLRSSAARDADVVQQSVRVGSADSAGNRWIYREQDGVLLRLSREAARSFAADSTLLYARKLTEFGPSSFVSADITRSSSKQMLNRDPSGELALREPKGFDPDSGLSSDLIQALGALTAERFVADRDDGSFGLEPPSLSVRFVFKGGDSALVEHALRFGSETASGIYASLDPGGPVFVLQRSVRDVCDTLLINRSVFPTSADALNSITIQAHGRALRLERHGEQLTATPPSSLTEDRALAVLDALRDLRPEAAIHTGPAAAPEGMGNPSLTLLLTPKRGPAQTVTFGAGDVWRSTSIYYLRVSGVDATFVMAQGKVRALSDAL